MSVGNLILLGAIGAGGYWAFQNGHLDAVLDRLGLDAPEAERADNSGLFETNSADYLQPASMTDAQINKMSELDILKMFWSDVQPWARRNPEWTAAMMKQESMGNTNATSSAGAKGLMQVMNGTQGDIYRWGWRKYSAEPQLLYEPNVGIYYGTAYLEYLSTWNGKTRTKEWMAQAYNAGPGGNDNDTKTWPLETRKYLPKINQYYQEFLAQSGKV